MQGGQRFKAFPFSKGSLNQGFYVASLNLPPRFEFSSPQAADDMLRRVRVLLALFDTCSMLNER